LATEWFLGQPKSPEAIGADKERRTCTVFNPCYDLYSLTLLDAGTEEVLFTNEKLRAAVAHRNEKERPYHHD